MKLTVLGSGSAISGAARCPSGYVISSRREALVLDFGFGCLKQLQKAGFAFTEVNNLLFSHFHADHINDLSAFCFARFAASELAKKPAKFSLFGPRGFRKFYMKLAGLYPELKRVDVSIKDLTNKKARIGKFVVQAVKVPHTENSIAFSVKASGRKIVYGGDCGYSKQLVKLAKRSDLLVLDCGATDKSALHLTPLECGQIAAKANAKTLVLTHFYPRTERINVKKIASKNFSGRIIVARDLMEVRL